MSASIVDAMTTLASLLASDNFRAEVSDPAVVWTISRKNRPHGVLEEILAGETDVIVFPLRDTVRVVTRAKPGQRPRLDQTYSVAIAIRAKCVDDQPAEDAVLTIGERVAALLVGRELVSGDDHWTILDSDTVALFDVEALKTKGLFISVRSFTLA